MTQEHARVRGQVEIEVIGETLPASEAILTGEALAFVAELHKEFNARRQELLAARAVRQTRIDAGEVPGFLAETEDIRNSAWQVTATPPDLQQRWAEITGPVERKMVIQCA